jgi:hypothetical protein
MRILGEHGRYDQHGAERFAAGAGLGKVMRRS